MIKKYEIMASNIDAFQRNTILDLKWRSRKAELKRRRKTKTLVKEAIGLTIILLACSLKF